MTPNLARYQHSHQPHVEDDWSALEYVFTAESGRNADEPLWSPWRTVVLKSWLCCIVLMEVDFRLALVPTEPRDIPAPLFSRSFILHDLFCFS